jgi:8-oxo-dGTP diphosphatase
MTGIVCELMTRGSGDGFVTVADGGVRWGRYGAAGILARHRDQNGQDWYFVARRSAFCHRGGTWGIPGGALDFGEEPLDGALREFAEEVGGLPEPFEVVHTHQDDHGGWSYWTIVVEVPERFPVPSDLSWETDEAAWVAVADLQAMALFDAFEDTLLHLGVLTKDL